jgi:hypothetical protein
VKKLIPTMVLAALCAAAPCFAGIHYQAVTKTQDAKDKSSATEVEGWVSGEKAKIQFKASANPTMEAGTYLLTRDGGKTLYLVNPEEKTYAEMDLQAMLGFVGGVMQGMGPLLKFEFSEPKVEKLLEEDGGTVAGLSTRHYRFRTSYTMKVKVLGMTNASDNVIEQDIWATDRLQDVALGVWLRSEPPRTGNEQFDKLLAAEMGKVRGFPLKTVTVTTTTQQKKGQQTVTRSSMEVTRLDDATVADASFEIPAGYQETQLLPTAPQQGEAGQGESQEEQGGLGGLLRRKKSGGR